MFAQKINPFIVWVQANKKFIYFALISLFISCFLYLNYINWTSGSLCTGKRGIQYGYDAARYINGAERILTNEPFVEKENRYLGYILLIALNKTIGFDLSFVLLFQLIFASFASFTLYDLARLISKSRIIGILAAGFYLINPFIVQWHLFIHTESLYSSLLVISAWAIYKSTQMNTFNSYSVASLIVIYTALVRPNGWAVIPIFLCFIIGSQKINLKIKLTSFVVVMFLFSLFIACFLIFNNRVKSVKTADLFMSGQVIWGHTELKVAMPKECCLGKNNSFSAIKYVFKHPVSVIKIGIIRIFTELFPLNRPYLSTKYILRFLFFMLPAYFFAVIGFLSFRRNRGVLILSSIIILHLCIIAITFSDQEFRFLIYILPLIYLLTAIGITPFFKKSFVYFTKK